MRSRLTLSLIHIYRQLSADEIAALFASANAVATEPKSELAEEVITEPVTEARLLYTSRCV